jgi:hypothetical protein
MMVPIAQRFKIPDLQAKREVEVLIPFVRLIPGLGVLVCNRDEDEKQQTVGDPSLQRWQACWRQMHVFGLQCELGWHGAAGGEAATSLHCTVCACRVSNAALEGRTGYKTRKSSRE